jgi:group I intron endonuclease
MGSGVYIIENLINHKVYIGSATSFQMRWNLHLRKLTQQRHHTKHLQSSWDLYGQENFVFWAVEEVEDRSKLTEREQFYLDLFLKSYFHGVYNTRKIAESNIGLKWTEETKRKLSEVHKGNQYALGNRLSDETRRKLSDIKKGKKSGFAASGKKHSEETKRKMSRSQKNWLRKSGRKLSESTKEKISKAMKGNQNGRKHYDIININF